MILAFVWRELNNSKLEDKGLLQPLFDDERYMFAKITHTYTHITHITLTNLLELSFRMVRALPKDSNTGLDSSRRFFTFSISSRRLVMLAM